MTDNVQEIFTDRITDPKDPMRSELDRSALYELADNIKQNGLINPITVRPRGDMFEVVAGHRRLAACRVAGKIRIACVVRELDDKQTFAVMAAENLERADVNPVDEATFIERYIKQTNSSIADTAKVLRRSVSFVETRLAIGQMPDYMKEALRSGDLKIGVALSLSRITDEPLRRSWVAMAVRDGVSVAQADYWFHGWEVNRLPGGAQSSTPPEGFETSAPPVVKFRCAIDGEEYDARTFKSIFIHDENMPVFNEMIRLFRSVPVPDVSSPSAKPTTTTTEPN